MLQVFQTDIHHPPTMIALFSVRLKTWPQNIYEQLLMGIQGFVQSQDRDKISYK